MKRIPFYIFIWFCLITIGVTCLAQEEMISLDLRGVEITELFKILSRKSGLNIVPSAQVKGRVNVFLNDVDVEDAIDVILVSQGLAAEKRGNIIYAMTAAEYQQTFGKRYYEKRKLRIFELKAADPQAVFNVFSQIKSDIGKIIVDTTSATIIVVDVQEVLDDMDVALAKLEHLQPQRIFELNYAKADEIEGEISKILTDGASNMQVDTRTNKLIITDLPDKMKQVDDAITAFDAATPQVFIEAEIIQVVLSDKHEQGISWERVFEDLGLHNLKFGARFHGDFPLLSSTSFDTTKQSYVSIGSVADDGYNAIIQFLDTVGRANILSRPRIAVLNNEEAKILIGTREAYTTGTLSQAESTTVTSEAVEFVDVGVKLNVVPRITHDGFIILKIKPEVSVVKEYVETKVLQSRIPIVETSEVETVIKIKDGSMIMIGGLIKKEKSTSSLGVPVLNKLPILSWFFSSKVDDYKKTELIIFLRPKIISGEGVNVGSAADTGAVNFKRPQKNFIR